MIRPIIFKVLVLCMSLSEQMLVKSWGQTASHHRQSGLGQTQLDRNVLLPKRDWGFVTAFCSIHFFSPSTKRVLQTPFHLGLHLCAIEQQT